MPGDNVLTLTANPPKPPLITAAVVAKLVVGKPLATPPHPVAGRRFAVAIALKRSDTGAPPASVRVIASVTVGGKAIRPRGSFSGGKARLAPMIPRTAKGKIVKIRLRITAVGQTTARVLTYRVR